MKYTLVSDSDGSKTLTCFIGGELYTANDAHPSWSKIIIKVMADDGSAADLFVLDQVVARKFKTLSDRVAVLDGQITFDGDIVNNALSQQILRFLDEDVADWEPLVNFYEKIAANPSENSKESLYRWLTDRNFTLYPDGDVMMYKSLYALDDGMYESVTAGTAFVNGVEQTGKIRQAPGDIVTMPRSVVDPDINSHCSVGLHTGNFRYAQAFSGNSLLECKVNPRDIIAVPVDSQSEKVRTCRYEIVGVIMQEDTSPIRYSEVEDSTIYGNMCAECGYADDYCECDNWDDCLPGCCNEDEDLPVYNSTRYNYRNQVRDAQGRFIPKS